MKRLVLAMVLALATAGAAHGQVTLPLPTSTTTTAPPTTTTAPASVTTESTTTTTTAPTDVSIAPPPAVDSLPSTTTTSTSAVTAPSRPVLPGAPLRRSAVASAITGSFALTVVAALAVAALLVLLSSRARPGGLRMNDPRRRWRLIAGAACLAVAAVIGLVGWLKVSDEPQVNRQIPYLASSGMGLVIFAAVGGSLLVAEQLREDDQRIEELEEALRTLSETLSPIIESPPRGK